MFCVWLYFFTPCLINLKQSNKSLACVNHFVNNRLKKSVKFLFSIVRQDNIFLLNLKQIVINMKLLNQILKNCFF